MTELEFKPKNPRAELVTNAPADILASDFRAAVIAASAVWSAHGIRPTAQNMMEFGFIKMNIMKLEKILKSDEFAVEMAAKGVPWNDTSTLTPEQILCIEVITNPVRRGSIEARLKSIGVTPTQFRNWKKNPFFADQLKQLTSNLLVEYQGEMDQVLLNQALEGKLDAIRYANEISGRHDPNKGQQINVQEFVRFVLQTVQTHVRDPEALMNIGNELAAYAAGSTASAKPSGLIAEYKEIVNGNQ